MVSKSPFLLLVSYFLRPKAGMTLIEVVISIAIISVISALLLSALPLIRSQQQLRGAVQQIQSNLRVAQQAALNESRPAACLTRAGDDKEKQRSCSDRGLAISNNTLIQFADTQDDNRFSASSDFIISQENLTGGTTAPNKAWLFEATPPTITLWVDGKIQPGALPANADIRAGALTATIHVYAYGYTQATF